MDDSYALFTELISKERFFAPLRMTKKVFNSAATSKQYGCYWKRLKIFTLLSANLDRFPIENVGNDRPKTNRAGYDDLALPFLTYEV